jgi:hypothetical protein
MADRDDKEQQSVLSARCQVIPYVLVAILLTPRWQ